MVKNEFDTAIDMRLTECYISSLRVKTINQTQALLARLKKARLNNEQMFSGTL